VRITSAFAEQGATFVRNGRWALDELETKSHEFLRQVLSCMRAQHGFDKDGHHIRSLHDSMYPVIIEDVWKKIRKTPEWGDYNDTIDNAVTTAPLDAPVIAATQLQEPRSVVTRATKPRGQKADMERHHRIAGIVGRHNPTWRSVPCWRNDETLLKICRDADAESIDVNHTWRSGKPQALNGIPVETWIDAATHAKKLVVEQIESHLKMVSRQQ
jgi:hypothetical protein